MFGSGSGHATDIASGRGKPVFSASEALKHINALAEYSSRPHTIAYEERLVDLIPTLQYVYEESQIFKETADKELLNVEIYVVPVKAGDSDQKNVVIKISPNGVSDVIEKAILGSAHDSSNVAVMLELARGICENASELKNGVIFFFNADDDEDAAHVFTQHEHPWSKTVRVAIDLEFREGKKPSFQDLFSSRIIQSATDFYGNKFENLDSEIKYPSGQIAAQDLFSTGGFDIQQAKDIAAGLPGFSWVGFARGDNNNGVYYTMEEKQDLLKPGSLQHLGESMLPFLLES